jgi:hypothetical protein
MKSSNMRNILKLDFALFISLSLLLMGCPKDDVHRYIYFHNNSNKTIYYGLSYAYPDTNLNSISQKPGYGSVAHKVQSGEETTLPAAGFAYNSTMQLFLFDAELIESNPWDSIVIHNMILKRYQYTETDMQMCNWTISYN